MQHIITLSGNSRRFTDAGLPHKALCEIAQQPLISHFINSFENFHEFDTIFLCRKDDLSSTNLTSIINKYAPAATIVGIDTNNLGPVYSILQIRDLIKTDPVFVSYIDTLQRLDLKEFDQVFNQVTDNYGCMVLDNRIRSTDIHKKVFWFKSRATPDFKVGIPQALKFHETHFDPEHDKKTPLVDLSSMMNSKRRHIVKVKMN